MTDASFLIPLVILGVGAVGVIPGVVIAYRITLIRRRIDDIEASIWSDKSIQIYLKLFTKEDPPVDRAATELAAIVRREFLAVHSVRQYLVSLVPLVVVVAAVVWTCCAWAATKLGIVDWAVGSLDDSVILALSGAYVWSVYEILGRYRSRDLTPDDLVEVALRHVAAVPIGYAFSLIALDKVAASMAFASAAFPLRDIRLFLRERALKKLERSSTDGLRPTEGNLATMLDGLSDGTLARLEELHISTYLDLAYVNPVRLMARTGHSLRHILAWIDQSLLAVYAPRLKQKFTDSGLPCALDAREFYERHCFDVVKGLEKNWRTDPTVAALAKRLEIDIELLPEILVRVHSDPHVQFLAAIWYSGDDARPDEPSATTAVIRDLPGRP